MGTKLCADYLQSYAAILIVHFTLSGAYHSFKCWICVVEGLKCKPRERSSRLGTKIAILDKIDR